jgi:hypothetical protein
VSVRLSHLSRGTYCDNAGVARAALARGLPVRPAPQSAAVECGRRRAAWRGRRKESDDNGCNRAEDETHPTPKPNRTAAAFRNPTG